MVYKISKSTNGRGITTDIKDVREAKRILEGMRKADPNKYQEISKKENILDKLCWTAPVLCRATIYLRNDKGDIISIDISKKK